MSRVGLFCVLAAISIHYAQFIYYLEHPSNNNMQFFKGTTAKCRLIANHMGRRRRRRRCRRLRACNQSRAPYAQLTWHRFNSHIARRTGRLDSNSQFSNSEILTRFVDEPGTMARLLAFPRRRFSLLDLLPVAITLDRVRVGPSLDLLQVEIVKVDDVLDSAQEVPLRACVGRVCV